MTARQRAHMKTAVAAGDIAEAQILHNGGVALNEWISAYAAHHGQLNMLMWLRAHDCPWDANTCSNAAFGGFLNTLQWARANGCPWDAATCNDAAYGGHLDILQWARAHGCPWDRATCLAVGFPYDVRTWILSGAGDCCLTKSAAPRQPLL